MTRNNFLNMTEEEYRAFDAISYSLLTSPKFIQRDLKLDAFRIGSYVDSLAFNQPLDKFVVAPSNMEIPNDGTNMMKFIKLMAEKNYTMNSVDQMKLAYDEIGIKRPKIEVFVADAFMHSSYLGYLINSKEKIAISLEEDMMSLNMVNELRTNPYTKKYFSADLINGCENLFQVPFIVDVVTPEQPRGFKVKALLDIVHIDHENKTIRPIDLKTMKDDIEKFKYSFIKYGYYIQAALYKFIIEQFIASTGLSDYKVLDFGFIPITKDQMSNNMTPMLYLIDEATHEIAMNGGTFANSNTPVKGVKELIKDYLYLSNLNNFDYSADVRRGEGVVYLSV